MNNKINFQELKQVNTRVLIHPPRPDWLYGPPSLLSKGYWSKVAGAWSWPLTSIYRRG